jgi:hypothetical protein
MIIDTEIYLQNQIIIYRDEWEIFYSIDIIIDIIWQYF